MASAEIIAIGTELLLGMTLDTNTHFLANQFRAMGIDLFRTTVIGDNEERISQIVQEALSRADIVITTGGLGPTIDDPTRNAIAKAYNVPLVFQPDLWELIQERFTNNGRTASDNNKRQAFLPQNAHVIPNAVGTAPAFYVFENNHLLVSLPGVPKEMEYLINNHVVSLINERFPEHSIIITETVHLIGIGESLVDEQIEAVEKLKNPTVGLSAHAGQIDIRITAKSKTRQEVESKIELIKQELYQKLGKYIFGEDETTLEQALSALLQKQDTPFSLYFYNHQNQVLLNLSSSLLCTFCEQGLQNEADFMQEMVKFSPSKPEKLIAFAVLYKTDKMILLIFNPAQNQEKPIMRSYMGPKEDFPLWVSHNELGYLLSLLKASLDHQ